MRAKQQPPYRHIRARPMLYRGRALIVGRRVVHGSLRARPLCGGSGAASGTCRRCTAARSSASSAQSATAHQRRHGDGGKADALQFPPSIAGSGSGRAHTSCCRGVGGDNGSDGRGGCRGEQQRHGRRRQAAEYWYQCGRRTRTGTGIGGRFGGGDYFSAAARGCCHQTRITCPSVERVHRGLRVVATGCGRGGDGQQCVICWRRG